MFVSVWRVPKADPTLDHCDSRLVVEGLDLPDGETLVLLIPGAETSVRLSPEEEGELLEAIAEADRGETISAEELFARLDRLR
jgi:hypothetical protein